MVAHQSSRRRDSPTMFLHLLEKDEKTTFLAFAKYLAKVDDKVITEKERFMLHYMATEMGLDAEEVIGDSFSEEQTVLVFHRDIAKRVLILEGVGIAFASGEVEPQQKAFLEDFAKRLMLPGDFVAKATAIVEKQLGLMEEMNSLVGH